VPTRNFEGLLIFQWPLSSFYDHFVTANRCNTGGRGIIEWE